MNDETEDRDENAGIGHVEGRPRVGKRHVQIEEREINDMAVQKPVGQVSHNPAEEERE
jgi:hypothetical protein